MAVHAHGGSRETPNATSSGAAFADVLARKATVLKAIDAHEAGPAGQGD